MFLFKINWDWQRQEVLAGGNGDGANFDLSLKLQSALERLLREQGFRLISLENANQTGVEVYGSLPHEDIISLHRFLDDFASTPGVACVSCLETRFFRQTSPAPIGPPAA